MSNCQVISIKSPKKYLLDGLWLGPEKAKTVYIFVHGLGGSLFSLFDLAESLVTKDSAVLVFNNRGFGTMNRIRKENKALARGYKAYTMGLSHEVFTDCVDDIDGAVNYVRTNKAKNIFLVGHSTGCQKSIYYLSKRPKTIVKGAVLLAPMSDYADMFSSMDPKKYKQLIALAKLMLKQGRAHELMPSNVWPMPTDAQRFLSLFSVDSEEEIFSYASKKEPKTLQKVTKKLLVILASQDECRERPIKKIAQWFEETLVNKDYQLEIINKARHNFKGHISELKKHILKWSL